jgi:alkanesulfonate monooxygenase SsuD/methylene tetrahydromethanopterin reductase-like flavin-dependent oxidoreductase (luciferase family)
VTQRLRIGTRVCLLPLREPIALAKDIATLARIAAWGDGWIPGMSSAAEIREGRDKLVAAAAAGDRDPADFTVVAFGLPGALIQ